MPQMAPLNWLSLFMFFSLIFMFYNSMNYFSFIYPIKNQINKKIQIKLNWQW